MNNIATSWALARTVDSVLDFIREAIKAASFENIPEPTLLACERLDVTGADGKALAGLAVPSAEAIYRW